ncbi:MAG: nucleoside hydrolase [Caulobacteraceae bacterium]|nr:nucleoside hydrolase [Caulobacteraceae bacterium]
MSRTPLIIDCDPGVDDAVALFLAFAAPDVFDLIGITTVAGNVNAELTARNARILRQIAGREDVPVYAGCQRPLVRRPVEADAFHGASGLGDMAVFEPAAPAAAGHAVDFLVQAVMSRPAGSVALAVTGPMTNLAAALALEPRLASHLGQVVAMGGARSEGGNITASAEYNIYADPHAAQVVFEACRDVVVLGLDATHQVRATDDRLAAIAAIPNAAAKAAAELLVFANRVERELVGGTGSPLHDPCTIAYLLAPQLFTTRPCRLSVETASPLTLGHTAVEFRLKSPDEANALWVSAVDAQGVFDLLTERLARL